MSALISYCVILGGGSNWLILYDLHIIEYNILVNYLIYSIDGRSEPGRSNSGFATG